MAFTIFGYVDGVSYHVHVPDQGDPDGTETALDLISVHQGTQVSATPTGPVLTVERADGASLLALFMAHSQITSVEGNPPNLTGPAHPGVVY